MRKFSLSGCENITDAGLANLKDMNKLIALDLRATPVTDAGLAQLKSLEGLKELNIGATPITDAGLAGLKDFKALAGGTLILTGCKNITDAGVASLSKDLPKTKITR